MKFKWVRMTAMLAMAAALVTSPVYAEDVVSTSQETISSSSTAQTVAQEEPAETEKPAVTPTPAAETPVPTPEVTPDPIKEETQTETQGQSVTQEESRNEEQENFLQQNTTQQSSKNTSNPVAAPDGETQASKASGSNEALIRSQNIVDLPDVASGDWRFQTVKDADKGIAKHSMNIMTSMDDNDHTVAGHLDQNNYAYILSEEDNGWVYVESGDVRGFAKKDQFFTGEDAVKYRRETCKSLAKAAAKSGKSRSEAVKPFFTTATSSTSPEDNPAYLYKHLTVKRTVIDKTYGIVNTQSTPLMMREAKDMNAQEVGSIPKGGLLYILEDDGSDFLYVESGDTKGYVRREYVRSGEDVDKEIEEKGEDSYQQAKKLVSSDENAALYHTFTSVKEYQEINPLRKEIMDLAETTLGHPYVWGGNDLYNGCDCSGLVQQIYKKFGISLPRVAEAQAQVGTKITPESAQPGDLIFYAENGYIYHVAIYAGEGKTVEAYGTDYGILSTNAFKGRPVCWCTNVIDQINS